MVTDGATQTTLAILARCGLDLLLETRIGSIIRYG